MSLFRRAEPKIKRWSVYTGYHTEIIEAERLRFEEGGSIIFLIENRVVKAYAAHAWKTVEGAKDG